jgi:non-ribosomal peptide synthase protein (TIGR01720 family)
VKEQLRAVPHQGVSYGLLRYLQDDETARRLATLSQPEISFNYWGQLDSSLASERFQPAPEPAGDLVDPASLRPYLIDVVANVANAQLRAEFRYSDRCHGADSISRLAQGFAAALRAIIDHCTASDAAGFTPSDFAEMEFAQDELDDLLGDLNADPDC